MLLLLNGSMSWRLFMLLNLFESTRRLESVHYSYTQVLQVVYHKACNALRCIEPYVSHGKSRFRPLAECRAANTSTTCSFLTLSCVGVQLPLFTPFDFHFFVLSVIQGLYVMLMKASHLEKCHWDGGIAELTSGLENRKTLAIQDGEARNLQRSN